MKKDTRIKEYLEILECLECGSDLRLSNKTFVCKGCKHTYQYKNGIPIFIAKSDKSQHIEKQSEIYDKEYGKTSYGTALENWQLSYINRTADLFGITGKPTKKPKRYLDIGAGPGHTVIELAKRGVISVGCDISYGGAIQTMKLAKRLGVADKCLYVVCDAAVLPFKKTSIDYVTCIMLLEHLENDYDVVSEISRILRKRGKVYIAVPNTYWDFWFFMWPINYWHDRRLGHLRHYSKDHLIKLCRKYKLLKPHIFYSAHLIKFVQLFYKNLPVTDKDKFWWDMEKKDESQHKAKTGLHLNGVFTK